jgi:hypothetical protein
MAGGACGTGFGVAKLKKGREGHLVEAAGRPAILLRGSKRNREAVKAR